MTRIDWQFDLLAMCDGAGDAPVDHAVRDPSLMKQ